METGFNGKPIKPKKPKRSTKWTREVDPATFEYIQSAHHQGLLIRTIAQIFTLDESIIQKIVLTNTHSDYKKDIHKIEKIPVAEEPAPVPRIIVPQRKKKVLTVGNMKKLVLDA
jgi:hypothetical protein